MTTLSLLFTYSILMYELAGNKLIEDEIKDAYDLALKGNHSMNGTDYKNYTKYI